jgi:hypothetical protein
MKRLLLVLSAVFCLVLSSCYKESHYTVQYHDRATNVANITLFEYDYGFDLVKSRELKYAEPGEIFEITSSDLARYVVVGVEGTVDGRIIEWYSAGYFELDSSNPVHIDVSFIDMETSDINPVNANDRVHRYLHK